MGPVSIVDVTVQRACDIYLERIGEGGGVTGSAHNVSKNAVVLRDVEGAVVILDCHVDRSLTEKTCGVAKAGAFHETRSVSKRVRRGIVAGPVTY